MELPGNDVYPEALVDVASWGEWEVSENRKRYRGAILRDGSNVKVYESGVVITASVGSERVRLVAPAPRTVLQSSEAARSLKALHYEKVERQFRAGIVSGAQKLNEKVRGLGGAVSIMGEAAFRTAAAGGRDGITAMKFIWQAADLAPAQAQRSDPGDGSAPLSLGMSQLGQLLAAVARAAAGGSPGPVEVVEVIEGTSRPAPASESG